LKLTKTDRDAVRLATEEYASRGAMQAERAKKKKWTLDFGESCATWQQRYNLDLLAWQVAPLQIENPNRPDVGRDPAQAATDGRQQAAELLKQMLALGVSRYHPNPVKAIEEAKRKGVKTLIG
jgi:hypothetical protein